MKGQNTSLQAAAAWRVESVDWFGRETLLRINSSGAGLAGQSRVLIGVVGDEVPDLTGPPFTAVRHRRPRRSRHGYRKR